MSHFVVLTCLKKCDKSEYLLCMSLKYFIKSKTFSFHDWAISKIKLHAYLAIKGNFNYPTVFLRYYLLLLSTNTLVCSGNILLVQVSVSLSHLSEIQTIPNKTL